MSAVRDVFADYRDDTHLCLCGTCRAVSEAARWVTLLFRGQPHTSRNVKAQAAHWAAISELLRELAEGRHRRVELADLQEPGRVPRPASHVSISDGLGIGIGIGGDLHRARLAVAMKERNERNVAFWATLAPTVPLEREPELGQASLFDLEVAS